MGQLFARPSLVGATGAVAPGTMANGPRGGNTIGNGPRKGPAPYPVSAKDSPDCLQIKQVKENSILTWFAHAD